MPTSAGAGTAATEARQALVERARGRLDVERIADLLEEMTAIPSPTGEEHALATHVAGRLASAGIDARVLDLGHDAANAVARLGRAGDGPTVLVYAPLDTAFAGVLDEDLPFLGPTPRADFVPAPLREGARVVGLGAENPKGFAAAGIAAFEALAPDADALEGEVLLGLVGGSMPVGRRPGRGDRALGHGRGIAALLDAEHPDAAVILKPGWAATHEEVGYAWFRVRVHGAVGYTGIRHKAPYRNPVLAAARLVVGLEAWFAAYTTRWSDGLVAPQGSVNAIHGGSPDRASFVPAEATLDLDLRISPRATPDVVEEELRAAIHELASGMPEVEVSVERVAAVPGSATDPRHWIVTGAVRAWEGLEGRNHEPPRNQSGASDVGLVRSRGIPAVRVGLPPAGAPSPYPGFSMGVADAGAVRRLAELLVGLLVDVTARSRDELGLADREARERGHG